MRIALSVGCPSGIGPEVSVLAALEAKPSERVVLVGDHGVIVRAAATRGIAADRFVRVETPAEGFKGSRRHLFVYQPLPNLNARDTRPGKPTHAGGAAQLSWINTACDLVSRGEADALVTGPVSKEMIAGSGARGSRSFRGHTEHLSHRLRAPEVVMAFAAPELTTALVTTHLRLGAVPRAITPERVATAAYWLGALITDLGAKGPRVAIASLNPHAGEGGLLGTEETTAIVPGMELARARLKRDRRNVTLVGPVPAESAFRLAAKGKFAAVLAMYHDQATIPMKIIGFGEAVNVSLGLPIVRTSVDHGTAYDIAGKKLADPRGMREAITLGARLAAARAR